MTQQKVNNFNLGLFLKTKIIVACGLTLIMLLPFRTYGASRCTNPVTDADAQKMCQSLISAVEAEKPIEEVTEQLVQFVLNKVNIEDKGTFGENDECYEVSRIQITLFCETEEKLILNEFKDIGEQKDQPVILVASCQTGERDDFKDIYASVFVQIFLKKIDSISIELSAGIYTLSPGESTDIKATLKCEECALKDKTVGFTSTGPGQISPEQPRTGAEGVATTEFTADKSGKTVVTAHYKNQKASIELNIIGSWDIIFTCYRYSKYNRWRSEVKFENIPLGPEWKKKLLDYSNLISEGTFTDTYVTCRSQIGLGPRYRGYSEGQPVWTLGIDVLPKDVVSKFEKVYPQETVKTDIVVLVFSNKWGSVTFHYAGGVYYLDYWKQIYISNEKLNEGKPFSIEFGDGILGYGGRIRFIPRHR